jgi:hypothetical protein
MANSWTNRVKFLVRWVLPYRATTVQRHFQQCIKPPVFPERYSYVCLLDNTLELFLSRRHSLLMHCKSPCRNVCHFTSIYIYIHLNLWGSHYLHIVMVSLALSLCRVYINFFRTFSGFSHKVPFLYLHIVHCFDNFCDQLLNIERIVFYHPIYAWNNFHISTLKSVPLLEFSQNSMWSMKLCNNF